MSRSASDYHVPVLLQETLDGLAIEPAGTYVDCTFGGGGHSRSILERLGPMGRLLAFDQDGDARANLPDDPRIQFVPHNFRHLERFLRLHSATPVDGILADLGVSSHQFDEAERGFSFRFDGDLDMRMDRRQTLTAFQVVDTYSEQQLHRLFERYGEVTNAKTLAKTIVGIRRSIPLRSIRNFRTALHGAVKGNPQKWFAQVFQALRIEVNDELGALKEMLGQSPALLKTGGRIAVITFHSLEDRIVKNFFRRGTLGDSEDGADMAEAAEREGKSPLLRPVNKKAISPGEAEIKRNPRARSAKLRVAEKMTYDGIEK